MPRPVPLQLDLGSDAGPLFLRIARAIEGAIRSGRLRRGGRIPGTRTLAAALEVHRNTVTAAYDELIAQGWITSQAARGTFVSAELPDDLVPVAHAHLEGGPGYRLPSLTLPPADTWAEHIAGVLSFTGIDARLLPARALSRAYRRALRERSGAALGYQIGRGHPRLLAALRELLATSRGIPRQRGLIVVRGSQMGLYLVIRALLQPGDVVAVEDPGYAFAWPTFRLHGVRLVPIPVDAQGLRVDRLAEVARRDRLRAVLVTPHLHYPTGVRLAASRRLELQALARARRFAIIEDDWMHDVRYEGRPVLPLASDDAGGVTVYLGSFSKVFAPSLRLGWVAAPEPVVARLEQLRTLIDVCGDGTLELAVAELLEDEELQRHVRRVTRIYRERRDLLVELLGKRLGSALTFARPTGGTALWAEVDPAIDVDGWARAGREHGVGFLTGRAFSFGARPTPHLWLGFAGLPSAKLRDGIERMTRALATSRASPQAIRNRER